MAEADDTGGSFDPRSWAAKPGKPAQPDPPKPEPAASFDPKSWAKDKPKPAESPPRAKPRRRVWLAAAAGVVLVGGGAALAILMREPAPTGAKPAAPAAKAAPAPAPGSSRRAFTLADSAELLEALIGAGASPDEAAAASAAALGKLGATTGEVRVDLTMAPPGQALRLTGLEVTRTDGSGAVVTRVGETFEAKALVAAVQTQVKVVRGEMDAESFYSSAVAAGILDRLVPDMAQAFAFDFDFQREIKPGDIFEAAFEQPVNASGEAAGAPRLVYAALQTEAKSKAVYRFQPPDGEAGWFDGAGKSIVRALMRTPIDGARVSSSFGYRTHPILGYQKLHKGVDFAAPTGTPIYASGEATVEWAAMKGANGNLVILRHDNGWQTYYLHMSAFGPGITAGVRVKQGQQVGAVGTTGRSTGPHLHYEVHIEGEAVDPMTIPVGEGRTLSGPALAAFIKERDRIDRARASFAG